MADILFARDFDNPNHTIGENNENSQNSEAGRSVVVENYGTHNFVSHINLEDNDGNGGFGKIKSSTLLFSNTLSIPQKFLINTFTNYLNKYADSDNPVKEESTLEIQLKHILKTSQDDHDKVVAEYSNLILLSQYDTWINFLCKYSKDLLHIEKEVEQTDEDEDEKTLYTLPGLYQIIHRVTEAKIPISKYTKMHPLVIGKQLSYFHQPSAIDFQTVFGSQSFEGDTINDDWVYITSYYFHEEYIFQNSHLDKLIRALKNNIRHPGVAKLETVQFHKYTMDFKHEDYEDSKIFVVIFKFKKNVKVRPLLTAIVPNKDDMNKLIKKKNNRLADKPPLKDRKTSDTDIYMKFSQLNRIDNIYGNIGSFIESNMENWWKDSQKLSTPQFNSLIYQLMNLVYDLFVASFENNWETSYILNVFNVGYEIDEENIKLSYQRSPIVVNNHFRVIMTSIALSLTKGSTDNYDDSCIYHRVFKHVPTMIGFHLKYQLWLLIKSFTLSHDDFMFSLTNPLYKKLFDGSSKNIKDCFPSGSSRYGEDTEYVNEFMKWMEERELRVVLDLVDDDFINFYFLNDEPKKFPGFLDKSIISDLRNYMYEDIIKRSSVNGKDTLSYDVSSVKNTLANAILYGNSFLFEEHRNEIKKKALKNGSIDYDLLLWMVSNNEIKGRELLEEAFKTKNLSLFNFAINYRVNDDSIKNCINLTIDRNWELGYYLLINHFVTNKNDLFYVPAEKFHFDEKFKEYARLGDLLRIKYHLKNKTYTKDEKELTNLFDIFIEQNDKFSFDYALKKFGNDLKDLILKKFFIKALKKGHTSIIKSLLEKVDINDPLFLEVTEETSFTWHLIKSKDNPNLVHIISCLLKWGVNVTKENKKGQSPLLLAAFIPHHLFLFIYDHMRRNKIQISPKTFEQFKTLQYNNFQLNRNFVTDDNLKFIKEHILTQTKSIKYLNNL